MNSCGTDLHTSKGVSLIEVLIGIVIIGFAAAILIFASRSSVTGQLRSKVFGDAATATREALDNIELLDLDSLSSLQNAPIDHSQGAGINVFASVRGLQPSDVPNIDDLDTGSLRFVSLRTEFKSKSGETVAKKFTTILFRP